MNKVVILTNSINGLYNFRKELIEKLIEKKLEVVIVAPEDEKTSYFLKIGCKCVDLCISRRGTNPITDFKLLLTYLKILINYKPDVVLTYTIKPNVYGGLACRILSIPYIVNITGLGDSIENGGIVKKISLFLYKIGLKKAKCVFFQNKLNQSFFLNNKIVKGNSRLIPGSGVNIEKFTFEEYPKEDSEIKFLFIGRIMKAKGIEELFEAAIRIKKDYSNVQFHIIGSSEEDYSELLKKLEMNKVLKYHGRQNNIHSFIKNSHAIIHPSHHEGMSNVLLEAASTGRPVIASNIPGCKETFDENISGIGFEVKNVDSLVKAIKKFIELPYEEKKRMGIAGRRKVENEFDRNFVIDAYIEEIEKIIGR